MSAEFIRERAEALQQVADDYEGARSAFAGSRRTSAPAAYDSPITPPPAAHAAPGGAARAGLTPSPCASHRISGGGSPAAAAAAAAAAAGTPAPNSAGPIKRGAALRVATR